MRETAEARKEMDLPKQQDPLDVANKVIQEVKKKDLYVIKEEKYESTEPNEAKTDAASQRQVQKPPSRHGSDSGNNKKLNELQKNYTGKAS